MCLSEKLLLQNYQSNDSSKIPSQMPQRDLELLSGFLKCININILHNFLATDIYQRVFIEFCSVSDYDILIPCLCVCVCVCQVYAILRCDICILNDFVLPNFSNLSLRFIFRLITAFGDYLYKLNSLIFAFLYLHFRVYIL